MESVNIRSRDQSRLPMLWNSEKNFGFSAHEPWLACNNQCDCQTVEFESADKDSVLSFYKAIIQLRNHSEYTQTLIYGDLEDVGYAIPETADVLMGNYADYDGTLRPYETVVYAV